MPERGPDGAIAASLRTIGEVLLDVPRRWAWVPLLAWSALIWFFSSRPPPEIGTQGDTGGLLGNFAHAIEYGMLAVWLALCVPRREHWPDLTPRLRTRLLVFVLVYAILDEVHQSYTPHRDASIFDVLTDVVGAGSTLSVIAGVAGAHAAPRRLVRRFGIGLLACFACAALATFVPQWLPGFEWM
jgi:hypothetical protein